MSGQQFSLVMTWKGRNVQSSKICWWGLILLASKAVVLYLFKEEMRTSVQCSGLSADSMTLLQDLLSDTEHELNKLRSSTAKRRFAEKTDWWLHSWLINIKWMLMDRDVYGFSGLKKMKHLYCSVWTLHNRPRIWNVLKQNIPIFTKSQRRDQGQNS